MDHRRNKMVEKKETKKEESLLDKVDAVEQKENIDKSAKYDNIPRRRRNRDEAKLKLDVESRFLDPNFKYRWVKGTPQRLQEVLDIGYEYVEDKELARAKHSDGTSRVSVMVGTLEGGSERRDYLMRIPLEWYKEDQEAKDEPIKEMMASIERGEMHQIEKGASYRPTNEIKVDRR